MGRLLTSEEVIKQFRETHGDFYDYSKFVYTGSAVKGVIICQKHGEFEQTPSAHKRGQGCPRCVQNRTLSQDEIVHQFRDKHGELYDYSKFVYVNDRTPSTIVCSTHGEFEQTPRMHKYGQGCPKCKAENRALSQDEVIQHFRDKHRDDYDYSKFVYTRSTVKGIIICPKHGEFEQSPNNHKSGQGCPKCASESAKGSYDSLSPEQRMKIKNVYLYYIELEYNDTIFHKVGITVNPKKRFYDIQRQSKSTILNGSIHLYENAETAFQKEQKILDYMIFDISKRYYHPIKFDGHSECFLPTTNPRGWNLDLTNIPNTINNQFENLIQRAESYSQIWNWRKNDTNQLCTCGNFDR